MVVEHLFSVAEVLSTLAYLASHCTLWSQILVLKIANTKTFFYKHTSLLFFWESKAVLYATVLQEESKPDLNNTERDVDGPDEQQQDKEYRLRETGWCYTGAISYILNRLECISC